MPGQRLREALQAASGRGLTFLDLNMILHDSFPLSALQFCLEIVCINLMLRKEKILSREDSLRFSVFQDRNKISNIFDLFQLDDTLFNRFVFSLKESNTEQLNHLASRFGLKLSIRRLKLSKRRLELAPAIHAALASSALPPIVPGRAPRYGKKPSAQPTPRFVLPPLHRHSPSITPSATPAGTRAGTPVGTPAGTPRLPFYRTSSSLTPPLHTEFGQREMPRLSPSIHPYFMKFENDPVDFIIQVSSSILTPSPALTLEMDPNEISAIDVAELFKMRPDFLIYIKEGMEEALQRPNQPVRLIANDDDDESLRNRFQITYKEGFQYFEIYMFDGHESYNETKTKGTHKYIKTNTLKFEIMAFITWDWFLGCKGQRLLIRAWQFVSVSRNSPIFLQKLPPAEIARILMADGYFKIQKRLKSSPTLVDFYIGPYKGIDLHIYKKIVEEKGETIEPAFLDCLMQQMINFFYTKNFTGIYDLKLNNILYNETSGTFSFIDTDDEKGCTFVYMSVKQPGEPINHELEGLNIDFKVLVDCVVHCFYFLIKDKDKTLDFFVQFFAVDNENYAHIQSNQMGRYFYAYLQVILYRLSTQKWGLF